MIDTFIEEGLSIAVVEYHNDDAYSNPDAEIREEYNDVGWFPSTYYDSNLIGMSDWNIESVHREFYEERIDSLSSFGVSIIGEVNDLTVSGTMYAEKIIDYSGQNLIMHLVITETHIPENWHGETEVNFVARKMFPDGNGTALNFSLEAFQSVDFSFDIDPSWVKDNCELVYFIQDNDTKEILQGNKILLNDLSLNVDISSVESQDTYIYPNPIQDFIKFHTYESQSIRNIQVVDLMGKVFLEQECYNSGINLSKLPQGIYLVSYVYNGNRKIEKVIKQ